MDESSKAPVPKVWAATTGPGLGASITGIVVAILQANDVEVSTELALFIGAVVSSVLTFAAGYLAPPTKS